METQESTRAALLESRARAVELENQIAQCKSAIERSQAEVAAANEVLAGFDQLDAEVARERAQNLKAGRGRRISEELQSKLSGRRAAEDELRQAGDAAEVLAAELKEAEGVLSQLKQRTAPIAAATIHAEIIAPLAKELAEVNLRQHELRYLLSAWFNLRIIDEAGWQSLGRQADVEKALRPYYGEEFIASANPAEEQTKRYKRILDALLNDPAVPIETPKLVQPSDFWK